MMNHTTKISEFFPGELIDQVLNPLFGMESRRGGYYPATDVHETTDAYIVSLDVPGVKKEDMKVNLHRNVLTVSGKRILSTEPSARQIHTETAGGDFSRSFRFTSAVDGEKVTTLLSNGVLTVTLQKAESSKPRDIAIQ